MTISNLWGLLRDLGLVEVSSDAGEILRLVEGKRLSIDASIWITQATSQPALTNAGFSHEAAVLKVTLERCLNLLRFGALPIGVLEGAPPIEKLRTLLQRNGGRAGAVAELSAEMASLGRLVESIFTQLGLPCVQAASEAEATAAALSVLGRADGVISSDADALLFGAEMLYKQLRLDSHHAAACSLERASLAGVRREFGLRCGGAETIEALALLAGADYDRDGVQRTGAKGAARVVRQLLAGADDDSGLAARTLEALRGEPDEALALLTKCTGCRCCGHAGRWSQARPTHGKKGCAACGTLEAGGCVAKAPEAPCECDFHRMEGRRALDKAIRRAAATPGYARRSAAASAAYAAQRSEARREAAAQMPSGARWLRRPSAQGLLSVLLPHMGDHSQFGTLESVRRKLLPALLIYDLSFPDDPEAVFVAAAVKQGSRFGAGDAAHADCPFQIMEWAVRPGAPPHAAAVARADLEWLAGQPATLRMLRGFLVPPELLATRGRAAQAKAAEKDAAAAKAAGRAEKAAARAAKAQAKERAAASQKTIAETWRSLKEPLPQDPVRCGDGGGAADGSSSDDEALLAKAPLPWDRPSTAAVGPLPWDRPSAAAGAAAAAPPVSPAKRSRDGQPKEPAQVTPDIRRFFSQGRGAPTTPISPDGGAFSCSAAAAAAAAQGAEPPGPGDDAAEEHMAAFARRQREIAAETGRRGQDERAQAHMAAFVQTVFAPGRGRRHLPFATAQEQAAGAAAGPPLREDVIDLVSPLGSQSAGGCEESSVIDLTAT